MGHVKAEPEAAVLIEAMRDIGYSLETAVADIVDNSITANARNIEISVDQAESPESATISILDDGCGMSWERLIQAMRPGSQNPLQNRPDADLGRFGLGMKTASFSQCRRLTVVTRKAGETCGACWDLDFVAARNEWLVERLPTAECDRLLSPWNMADSGTLILWEKMDRVHGGLSGGTAKDDLYERLGHVQAHLELVFHRFLSGEKNIRRVGIRINGSPLDPFDPFHTTHPATVRQPTETIKVGGGSITVKPFILPHHNKVTPKEWKRLAGAEGYLRNQGFYVYRAGRLIIHGTWFRLAAQQELTKLARVQVDIPNGLDHIWKLDVKKSMAQPPYPVKQRLKKVIERITGQANKVYRSRGKKAVAEGITPLWQRRHAEGQIFYEINRDHPVLVSIREQLCDQGRKDLDYTLSALEKSFPVDLLYSDVAGNPETVAGNEQSEETLVQLARVVVSSMRQAGTEREGIIEALQRMEPWRSDWERAAPLVTEIVDET